MHLPKLKSSDVNDQMLMVLNTSFQRAPDEAEVESNAGSTGNIQCSEFKKEQLIAARSTTLKWEETIEGFLYITDGKLSVP